MKRHFVYAAAIGVIVLVGLLNMVGFALGVPSEQLDPTTAEMTIEGLVQSYFTQTAEAPLIATAQSRFNEAVVATVEADKRRLDRDFTDGDLRLLTLPHAFGAEKDFWQVWFTEPIQGRNRDDFVGGIDTQLASMIDRTSESLDIVAFEFDNTTLETAILSAHARGVQVRVVTDNEFGVCKIRINPTSRNAAEQESELNICLEESSILRFIDAGIPVVDDARSGLMHDKFMILDGAIVTMGSMNYTFTGSYKNNENVLILHSPQAVAAYQSEFDEMFEQQSFGRRSPTTNSLSYEQEGVKVQILFASEDNVNEEILRRVNAAERSIRFLAFSFTLDPLGAAMREKANDGVRVEGIFEWQGSGTEFSELSGLFCENLDVRRDGNMEGKLHNKVIIIDDQTVLTGSFNFSLNATLTNDENMIIIEDPDLAAQYLRAFDQQWAIARIPELSCEL